MKVYGYTDGKKLVPVDLTVDEVVAKQIDPWRMDLFDPAPIDIAIGGQLLHFRRRREFSFVHKISDSEVIVGLHDGTNTMCISGRLLRQEIEDIRLDQLKPLPNQFDAYLTSYLRVYAERHPGDQYAEASYELRNSMIDCLKEDFWILPPTQPTAVVLHGNWLSIELGREFQQCMREFQFVGEMFAERFMSVTLPPQISSILNELQAWHPRIYDAERVRRLLRGQRNQPVEIVVDVVDDGALAVIEQFNSKNDTIASGESTVGDCKFVIAEQGWTLPDQRYMCTETNLHSVSCLYLDGHTLRGARIALFDLAKGQARAVRVGQYWDRFATARKLWLEGFKFIEVPKSCEREEYEYVIRLMIRANIPGTRSLCRLFDWCLKRLKESQEYCAGRWARFTMASMEQAQMLVESLRDKFGRSA